MRRALVVGIDYYENVSRLHGCVSDARAVAGILERHNDGTLNFGPVNLLTGTSTAPVSRAELKKQVQDLFADDGEIALFYFAGHGHIESTGGYLCASDCQSGDDGVPLGEVLHFANQSKARNRVIVLDSCHAGIAGSNPRDPRTSELTEGLTILTASTEKQYATEKNGSGVFTSLFVEALNGAGANLVGDVTPGSVYAHVDISLGKWGQRPVFKTNVKTFLPLRKARPPIDLAVLLRLTEFFPEPGYEFKLDPSFEPERPVPAPAGIPAPNPENTEKFAVLQKYNRVNLVVPVGAPHMWHAAMESKSCRLTALGEHYRSLAERNLI